MNLRTVFHSIHRLNDHTRLGHLVVLLLGAGIVLLRVSVGYTTGNDTQSYVESAIFRTPLYPVFLNIFVKTLGPAWIDYAYVFQILIASLSVGYFTFTVRRLFELKNLSYVVLFLIMLSPVFGPNGIGNRYYTEWLAYSFLMFIAAHFFTAVVTERKVTVIYICLLIGGVLLARPQLIFTGVLVGLLAAFFLLKTRRLLFPALSIGIFVGCVFLSNLGTMTYNYAVHDFFGRLPFLGMNLSTAALYVSHPDDATLVEEEVDRKFAREVLTTMEAEESTLRYSRPENFITFARHFHFNYNQICWTTVHRLYKEKYRTHPLQDGVMHPADWKGMDRMTTRIALTLLARNWPNAIKIYLSNILNIYGGYYYFGFSLLALLGAAYVYLRTELKIFFVLASLLLLNFTNYVLVGVLQDAMLRYTFYTDTLQFAAYFLFLTFIVDSFVKEHGRPES